VWLKDKIEFRHRVQAEKGMDMQREQALALLREYVTDPSLIRHGFAVEAAMRAYARKLGQDEEKWGIVGLLHDFDYERWPTAPEHPLKGSEILRERGYPEDSITSILSHADYLSDRYPRLTLMDKALYACDELTGLITATARLRPAGITDLTASSVKKKMKSKGFARGVNREDVIRGSADFGVDLDEHIQFVIDAMKTIAAELELLRGSGAAGADDRPQEQG
jgi:putative nucleotidyltransferase with HDIG domain